MKKRIFFKRTKSLANSLFQKSLIAFLLMASVISGIQIVNAENAIEPIEIITDTESIEESKSKIIVHQYSSTPDVENIEGARTLQGAKYNVYADEQCTQFIATLTTNEAGFTDALTVPFGDYYVKQIEISKRYSLDKNVYHVSIGNQQKAIIHSKNDPQLTTIDPSELPPIPMPFAWHNVTTDFSYGTWYLAGPGAYGQQSVLYVDGVRAFCLEGNKSEVSGSNWDVSWSDLGMDGYKEKLVLMGYYGYWANQSAVNYYLTQSLIWDEVMRVQQGRGWQVYTSSSYYGYTSLASMQWFFDDVRSKVNNFYTKPSWNNYVYNVNAGETINIVDNNGVLSDCYIQNKGGTTSSITGNTLNITAPSTAGEYTLHIKRGTSYLYNNNLFAVRYNSSSQAMSTLDGGITWDAYVTIRVKEPNGNLEIQKTSANTEITDGNDCYSLEGAEYGVYSDRATTSLVGKLITDKTGKSNSLSVKAGTYYVKELLAPKGYALDSKVHTVTVTAGQTNTLPLKDLPQTDPILILLGKVDKETNANKPQGSASLENAEFTVKYYKGFYDSDPSKQGIQAERSWIFKTRDDGKTAFVEDLLVSGDDFYYTSKGWITLPLGTITIQETKAPLGYHINNEVFVRQITSAGDTEGVDTYNMPTIPETIVKFYLKKYERGTTNAVKGVTFEHTKPDGTTETLTTNASGEVEIVGLESGQHMIKEVSTIDGLIVNPNVFTFNINADGTITNTTTDLNNKLFAYSEDSDGNGQLTVYNDFADFTLALLKINDDSKRLEGATFNLYDDENCTHLISSQTTNASGYITFGNLDVDKTYYFREEKAPDGYRLPLDQNGNPVIHSIRIVNVSPVNGVFQFEFDGQLYDSSATIGQVRLHGTPDNYHITADVINTIGIKLPVTGSSIMIGFTTFALFLIVLGVAFGLTARKTQKENDSQ